MTITFLGSGTSQGIPVIGNDHPVCLSKDSKDKRLRSSVYVETEKLKLIIDCGPDFRTQILRENITELDAILFTHEHSDHTAGLDDIRQFTLKNGALPIYAHKRVLTNLEKRFDYIFDKKILYKGKPEVTPHKIENSDFYIKDQKITPIDMLHGQLQTFGFRLDDFAYLTDVSYISEKEKEKLQGLKILIVDTLRVSPHPTHFNLEASLALIAELKPGKTYFTHISHMLGFHEKVQKSLPKNVYLGYDGLKISIKE